VKRKITTASHPRLIGVESVEAASRLHCNRPIASRLRISSIDGNVPSARTELRREHTYATALPDQPIDLGP
jgi:hypothetical protein